MCVECKWVCVHFMCDVEQYIYSTCTIAIAKRVVFTGFWAHGEAAQYGHIVAAYTVDWATLCQHTYHANLYLDRHIIIGNLNDIFFSLTFFFCNFSFQKRGVLERIGEFDLVRISIRFHCVMWIYFFFFGIFIQRITHTCSEWLGSRCL